MRIVHVAPFYYPVIGGVEEVVRRIAEYMASRGHDVYLTCNRLRVDGKFSLQKHHEKCRSYEKMSLTSFRIMCTHVAVFNSKMKFNLDVNRIKYAIMIWIR